MDKFDEIMNLIYTYYPQNCNYSSNQYKNSTEYLEYVNVLKNSKRRMQIDEKSYKCIKSAFKENYITRWTSTEYPSLHYSVLLQKKQPIMDDDVELLDALKGRRLDLEIYISLLGNFFILILLKQQNH